MAQTTIPAKERRKAWAWFAVKVVVSVGLLALLLAQVSLGDAFDALNGLSWSSFAAAVAIVIVAHAVNARRLCVFLPGISFGPALRFTVIGTCYSTVLPSQLVGDAIKAVRLARAHDNAGRAIAAVVRDKIMGLIALIVLSLAAVPLSMMPGQGKIAAALLAALAATAFLWWALDRLPQGGRWALVAKYLPRAADTGLSARQLAENFVWGLVLQALVVAIFAVVGIDLGLDIAAGAWIVIVGVVSLILFLPVTVAGVGLREGSLIGFMGALGQDPAATLALSLVILVLSLMAAAIGFVLDVTSRDRVV